MKKVTRYKPYFKNGGGITFSGGEPLLQAEFCKELFTLCKEAGINTCLDTSGSVYNDKVLWLLQKTDRVLLDIKYTTDEDYRKYAGCSIVPVLNFLEVLEEMKIKTTVRRVVVPTLNDTTESLERLLKILSDKSCVDKIELLPFKTICKVKYDALGLEFPLGHLPTPTSEKMEELKSYVNKNSRFG